MWQEALRDLITNGQYSTQSQLVRALGERGHVVNQSSVSRELRARHVDKVGGRYVLPVNAGLPDAIDLLDAQVTTGPLVVLRTVPAGAPMLAQVVDRARIPGVLGTLAGDDTVFVACTDSVDLAPLSQFLGRRITLTESDKS